MDHGPKQDRWKLIWSSIWKFSFYFILFFFYFHIVFHIERRWIWQKREDKKINLILAFESFLPFIPIIFYFYIVSQIERFEDKSIGLIWFFHLEFFSFLFLSFFILLFSSSMKINLILNFSSSSLPFNRLKYNSIVYVFWGKLLAVLKIFVVNFYQFCLIIRNTYFIIFIVIPFTILPSSLFVNFE